MPKTKRGEVRKTPKKLTVDINESLNSKLDTLSEIMCISKVDLVENYLREAVEKDMKTLSTCWTLHMTEEDLNEYA